MECGQRCGRGICMFGATYICSPEKAPCTTAGVRAMNVSSVALQRSAPREQRIFMRDVVAGLRTEPKHLLCKYFYDKRGSELFERICQLDEYYLTRCELAIMDQFAGEMGTQIGPGARLVEYGSGSSV